MAQKSPKKSPPKTLAKKKALKKPLKILFIHQNFPGQYRRLAPALAADGHDVTALGTRQVNLPGVRCYRYQSKRKPDPFESPLLRDHSLFEARGEATAAACAVLRDKGYYPDVIFNHPGWGEGLFLRDVFPNARIIFFCEYFYNIEGQNINFDPEFPRMRFRNQCQLRMKNTPMLHSFTCGDDFIAPTQWQKSTFPAHVRDRIRVLHEGIDYNRLQQNPDAEYQLPDSSIKINRDSPVLTYVARNLEPIRGFHTFMRALPIIQPRIPNLRVVLVGGNDNYYNAGPRDYKTWREALLTELDGQLDLSRMHFTGRVDYGSFISILQCSSVHVYLGYPFVVSWSFLESFGLGPRVIMGDTASTEEFSQYGRRVPALDSKALAEAICEELALHKKIPPKRKVDSKRSIFGLEYSLNEYRRLLRN